MEKAINIVLALGNAFWIFCGICMFAIKREPDAIMSPKLLSVIMAVMLVISIAMLLAASYQWAIQEHVRKNGWFLLSGVLFLGGSLSMYLLFFNGFALWVGLNAVTEEMYRLYYGPNFVSFRIILTIYSLASFLLGVSCISASRGCKALMPLRPRVDAEGRNLS